jgi:hypothetical protein
MAGASGSKASSTKAAPSGGLSLGVVYRLQAGAESLYPAYEVLCGLLDSSSRYRTVAWPRKLCHSRTKERIGAQKFWL